MIIFPSWKPQRRAVQYYNKMIRLQAKQYRVKNKAKNEKKILELKHKLKTIMERYTPIEIEIDPSKGVNGYCFYKVPSHPNTAYGCLECPGLIKITSDFKAVSHIMKKEVFKKTYGFAKTITCYCTECNSDGKCVYDGCRYFPFHLYD